MEYVAILYLGAKMYQKDVLVHMAFDKIGIYVKLAKLMYKEQRVWSVRIIISNG